MVSLFFHQRWFWSICWSIVFASGELSLPEALLEGLQQEGNFAIIDKDGSEELFAAMPDITGTAHAADWSAEAAIRRSERCGKMNGSTWRRLKAA